MPKAGAAEHEILRLIMESGEDGLLQSELWKVIGADSREGSRVILKLERKGLVKRVKELHDGRWTYRVFAKRKYSTIDSIVEIPCSFCDLEANCPPAWVANPNKCENLTRWLEGASKKLSQGV